ncbi:hypothetical protein HER18_05550 [Chryseobacterium sp. NEB161]|nr:hypothetical protein HER18_05550 [Chryseobacterium sp. NEB161]
MEKLNLITEFDEFYKGSDLQKIVSHKPLPIKYTIDGFDFYFYNADLFGLFEWNIKKDGLTTSDFIDDYKKGFEAGLLHLKTSEEIELKDLKSKDLREGTISQLKYILHEREFQFGSKGLLDLVFNKLPLIFTKKIIFDYGYWNGIIYSIDKISEKAGLSPNELKALPPQQMEVKNSNIKPTITINSEAKETVFSILKDFFETEQQDEFKEVLATFGTVKNKLIFKSYSNQFTDTFKKLFENNFILGCQKTDLINWIVSNFNFMYRKEVKEFKTKTVEQIISGNQTPCKSPIIEIKNGQILKIDY